MVAPKRTTFNESVLSVDSTLNAGASRDAGKKKPAKVKVEFNHAALRKALTKSRKFMKLNLTYASEACGIAAERLSDLERGHRSNTPELSCKFNVHELLSVCLAFDLNIWDYTIMPVQMSIIDGSNAERRDRAWAECQAAWQQNEELRQMLLLALDGKLVALNRKRAQELCRMPRAGTVGVG